MSNCVPEPLIEPRINPSIYKAAIHRNGNIDLSALRESDLQYATYGNQNTLLHLAAAAGNVDFLEHLLDHSLFKPELALATNVDGNTALHVAAEGGHHKAVEILTGLPNSRSLVNLPNNLQQTALFKACEAGHLPTAKKLLEVGSSTLALESSDGRTCLHVAVTSGNAGLLKCLLRAVGQKDILFQSDKQNGNTVLHLAVWRNCLSMIKSLLESHPDLCYYLNVKKETPLCMAVRLGFLDIVKKLIRCRPDCIQIPSLYRKNVLHLAVEHRHVGIVKYLTELKEDLSQLINQPHDEPQKDSKAEENSNLHADGGGMAKEKSKDSSSATEKGVGGDTPLHIAARHKNLHMVELLLRVPGVNKNAVNNQGVTPLDIARDNTEYHEPYKMIAMLTSYRPKSRPFLYNAPTVSDEKHKKSVELLEKAYSDRRTTELVAAVLLATMAFSAIFQVPGGFRNEGETEVHSGSPSPSPAPSSSGQEPLGSPILIGYTSFKLFLIFDCVAFFLSLFVVLMWTISTPLTTGDLMLFMCITATVTCVAFAFVAYGFMAAVYAVLAHRTCTTLAWIILGSSILICLGGNLACFYIVAKFAVRRARFHRLCGVPHLADYIVEYIWIRAEKYGILDPVRNFQDLCIELLTGHLNYALFTGHKKTSTSEATSNTGGGAEYTTPTGPSESGPKCV